MRTIILISGFKNSGKDFVADILTHMIDGDTHIMHYAEPLKDIIATTFNIHLDDLDVAKNHNIGLVATDGGMMRDLPNFREILQRFGTEAMKKHFGENVWSDLFISKLPSSGTVICPDWRFMPEFEALCALKDTKVVTLRVDNHNMFPDTHSSETSLLGFNFNYRIDNTQKDDRINDYLSTFLKTWLPKLSKT